MLRYLYTQHLVLFTPVPRNSLAIQQQTKRFHQEKLFMFGISHNDFAEEVIAGRLEATLRSRFEIPSTAMVQLDVV